MNAIWIPNTEHQNRPLLYIHNTLHLKVLKYIYMQERLHMSLAECTNALRLPYEWNEEDKLKHRWYLLAMEPSCIYVHTTNTYQVALCLPPPTPYRYLSYENETRSNPLALSGSDPSSGPFAHPRICRPGWWTGSVFTLSSTTPRFKVKIKIEKKLPEVMRWHLRLINLHLITLCNELSNCPLK